MNSVSSTPSAEPVALRSAARPLADRLAGALPLATIYAWLCTVYVVEALGRRTPWLFDDELKATQLARGIAATGHPMQRGQRVPADSLYNYATAPLWLFHSTATAYAGVKYLDVFVMASVVFPTYFLARLVVGRRAALFAAAGAGAIPSLAYSSYLVEETFAYPWAALCFFLLAKALLELRRGRAAWRWVAAAVLASLVAPLIRGELAVVPAIGLLALGFVVWTSDWGKERRRAWSSGDWTGAVLLALGAIFLFSAVMSDLSHSWLEVTRFYKHRLVNMTGWAAGALAVGLGVVPLSAGLAWLFRARGEERSRELRVVRSLSLAGLIGFGLYTGIKAAYLSAVFATRVEERNLIYVSPLLFVGTAFLLDRRKVNGWALAGATAFAAYLVGYGFYHTTQNPYEMSWHLYSDALGVSILQQANRLLAWTPEVARVVLLALAVVGGLAVGLLPRLGRYRLVGGVLATALAAGLVGWTLTGEIAAASGTNAAATDAATTLSPTKAPFTWVDDVTKGQPTLYEGEGEVDQNPEWLLEFWNRSIVSVGSLDGTVGGPGHAGAPNVTPTGKLFWGLDPAHPGAEYAYAVEDWPCVDFAGALAKTHLRRAGGHLLPWRLIRLTQPNRLRSMCTGLYPDGWTGTNDSTFFRFSDGRGWLRVVVSRAHAPGTVPPSPVQLVLGKVVAGPDREPVLGAVVRRWTTTIASEQTKVLWLPTSEERFALDIVVERKFVPHDYLAAGLPGSGDLRTLGAVVSYRFFPTLPRGARPAR